MLILCFRRTLITSTVESFNHGSAQAIGIIAQFICDQLVNSCGADATAKATCATAETAVNNAPAKTGGQADAFNAVFGIKTVSRVRSFIASCKTELVTGLCGDSRC